MENPKCPYCGGEMVEDNDRNCIGELLWYYKCTKCSSISPPYWKDREAAYAAAMKRDRAKGEWIDFGDELDKSAGRHSYQCSNCFTDASYFISGFEWDEWTAPHFCPNCGADMRKEENDADGN